MSVALKLDQRYTYADLQNWPEDERWELLDGTPYLMASPNLKHQDIALNLGAEFRAYLRGKTCKAIISPIDVRLNADKGDDSVVQPDLLVVCDPDKLADGKTVKGAPDLVVEILSPSNSGRDRTKKFQKYRDAKVKEIWFIDPDDGVIEVFIKLDDDKYSVDFYGAEDMVPVDILPGFEINMKDIFQ